MTASGPLAGIRIVERAEGAAAAYAGRMLAALGAEVTMAEGPQGTALRYEPPFLTQAPETSALFAYLGAGKQSVVCDMETDAGRAQFAALLEGADVLLDDTPVAQRPALGLDPATVADRYPGLIFTSILPFGAMGSRANWSGRDINVLHAGGEGYLMPNGLAIELFPDRPPVKIYGHFAEYQGGTAGAIATVAALAARAQTGGQFVDVSSQDAIVAESCIPLERFSEEGVIEHRSGRSFRYGGVIECADGYVEVLTLEQRQWQGLVELVGAPEWKDGHDDPMERGRRGAEINRRLRAWMKSKTVAEMVERGQALRVPIAKYFSPAEVLADPHERARGFFTQVQIPGYGECEELVAPFQFSLTPPALAGGPPRIGEHDG